MSKTTAEANREIAYRLSNNLVRLLREFSRDFEGKIIAGLHRRGHSQLRPGHSAVMANLGMGAVRVTELAERAQVTQQAMGKMLKELERIGYIARDIDSKDKRAKEIRLTKAGIQLAIDSLEVVDEIRQEYDQKVGKEELTELEDKLRTVVNKIGLTYLPESWSES